MHPTIGQRSADPNSFWRRTFRSPIRHSALASRALATGLIVLGQLIIIIDIPKFGFLEHAMQREFRSAVLHFILSYPTVGQLSAVAVALAAVWTILVLRDKVAERIIAAIFFFTLVEIGCIVYAMTLGFWPGLSSGIK